MEPKANGIITMITVIVASVLREETCSGFLVLPTISLCSEMFPMRFQAEQYILSACVESCMNLGKVPSISDPFHTHLCSPNFNVITSEGGNPVERQFMCNTSSVMLYVNCNFIDSQNRKLLKLF